MTTAVTFSTDPVADPNATPPANAKETANGGVSVSPPDPTPKTEDTPKTYAGKYKSVEDLEKGYVELEKKIGTQSAPPKPDASTVSGEAPKAPTTEQVRDAVSKAGLNIADLNKEYAKDGKLSEATLKTLNDKGITAEMVNAYTTGVQAIQTQQRAALAEVAGGEDGLKNLYEWVGTNVPANEVDAYNQIVETGSIDAAKLALQGFVSRYNAAVGKEPATVDGEPVPAGGDVAPYASNAEVVRAMSDPLYQTDEAYRQRVYARLARS